MSLGKKNISKNISFALNITEAESKLVLSAFIENIIKKKYDCNSYLVSDVSDKKNIPVYNNVDIKNYSINFKFKNFKYFLIFLISLYDLFKFYFKTLFVSDKIEWLIKNFKCKVSEYYKKYMS